MKIRVSICDDMPYACQSIEMRLKYEDDMEFVGATHSSADCLEMVKENPPDVLLLDIQLGAEDIGIDIISELKAMRPEMKILMLTSYNDEDYVFSSLVNGADDYVIKSTSHDKVLEKIRQVSANGSMLDADILQRFIKKSKDLENSRRSLLIMYDMIIKLSKSEYEVLRDIYDGLSYKAISEKRYVEECTIRTLASRIIKKFQISSMKSLIDQLKELRIFDSI